MRRPHWRRGPDLAGEPANWWTWDPFQGVHASVSEMDHVFDGPHRWTAHLTVDFWASMRPDGHSWPRGRTSFARRRDAQDWCRRAVALFITHERAIFLNGGK